MHSSLHLRTGLLVCGLMAPAGAASAWAPPIGIPAPPFGIDQETTDTAFTHWVDDSVPACSDSGPGTPAQPRCTIPATLPAGSIVQVRSAQPGNDDWTFNGTAAQPVIVRGPTGGFVDLGSDADVTLHGTYGIVENFQLPQIHVASGIGNHHLSIRNNRIVDADTGTALVIAENSHHVVIYNNEIARNGEIPSSTDQHGIGPRAGTNDIWIVDNHIHHNSGDGIQFCNSCVSGTGNTGPANVYIGRNLMHEDEENAIDLKEFQGPVVISQNRIHGYVVGLDSSGDAIRINDEGAQGQLWILFNDIWDSRLGVNASGATASAIHVVGNEMHGITSEAIRGVPEAGSATMRVVNNTVVNVASAILAGEARNNVVRATATAIGSSVAGCSHNLVQQGSVQATCTNGKTGDPKLATSGVHVTGLQPDSPAIDAGLANHASYSTFQTAFGRSIAFDRLGVARPQGAGWDIGAHEHPADLIFKDGFETGNLSRWSATSVDGTDVLVVPPGMAGTVWASNNVVDDTTALYVQDDSPSDEPRYRARFYLDPTAFDPGTVLAHFRTRVFVVFTDVPQRRVAAVVLKKQDGQLSVMARTRRDDNVQVDTPFFAIAPGTHAIELDLGAASAAGVADGHLSLWIDGDLVATLSGLENSAARADFARLGALSVKGGAAGVLRFDEFESRRTSYIGPIP
jgi:hypothetical protein